MANSGINHIDRDPKTGQLLPGHTLTTTSHRVCAQKVSELKAAYYGAVTPEDITEAHNALMDCVRQTKDGKLRIAAIALLFDRCLGKAEQHINVQSENRTLSANVNITPDQQQVLEKIISQNSLSVGPAPLQIANPENVD